MDDDMSVVLAEALRQARSARGTDDSGNDWLLEPTPAGHVPTLVEPCTPEANSQYWDDYEEFEADDPMEGRIPANVDQACPEPDVTNAAQNPDQIGPMTDAGFLTITVRDLASQLMDLTLTDLGINQYHVDLSTKDSLTNLLDEVMWGEFFQRLQNHAKRGLIQGALLMHHGSTMNKRFRSTSPYGDKGVGTPR